MTTEEKHFTLFKRVQKPASIFWNVSLIIKHEEPNSLGTMKNNSSIRQIIKLKYVLHMGLLAQLIKLRYIIYFILHFVKILLFLSTFFFKILSNHLFLYI